MGSTAGIADHRDVSAMNSLLRMKTGFEQSRNLKNTRVMGSNALPGVRTRMAGMK